MIKSDIIAKIAVSYPQHSMTDISLAVNKIIEQMTNTLVHNQRIEIRGFGSFSLHFQPARKAHNPKTQEKIISSDKYRPHFKPGKALRDRINLMPTKKD